MRLQPCALNHAPVILQPYSLAAMQPCSHAAVPPCSPAALPPCRRAALQLAAFSAGLQVSSCQDETDLKRETSKKLKEEVIDNDRLTLANLNRIRRGADPRVAPTPESCALAVLWH